MVSSAVCRFKPSVGLPDAAETVVLWDSTNGGRVSGLPHRDRFVADIYCSHAGTAKAEYSVDRGATWVEYDSVSVSAWVAGSQNLVEFAIGEYRDVRVSFTSGDDAQTTFLVLACLTAAEGDTGTPSTLDALPAQLVPGATTITGTGRPASVTVDGYECTVEYTGGTWSAVVPADVPVAVLIGLGQTARFWTGIAAVGADVYATVYSGDVYKQTGGTGAFAALGGTVRSWISLAAVGNDVYATVFGGDIYRQTGGTGAFEGLGQTTRNWIPIAAVGADVYAAAYGADIYKQTGGAGDFVALGQTSRNWYGLSQVGADVYAAVYGGDIYMQTGGTGAFAGLGQTTRNWRDLCVLAGDVYAIVADGDIYKQTGGAGAFAALGQTSRKWRGVAPSGSYIYATVENGDIYRARVLVDVALDGVVAGTAPVSWSGA